MRRSMILVGLLSVSALVAASSEHLVEQKNKLFSTKNLKVKAGDTVTFRNDDPFFHYVFSLSEGHAFELGSLPQGQTRKITLASPGTLEVECAIHPEMKMIIQVEP
jgi:plastocyanin